jgi:prevent-host-death family protein
MAQRETVPFAQARKELSRIVDQVSTGGRPVVITKRQKPVAIVVGLERYRSEAEPAGRSRRRRIFKVKGIARGPADVDRVIAELRRSRIEALVRRLK